MLSPCKTVFPCSTRIHVRCCPRTTRENFGRSHEQLQRPLNQLEVVNGSLLLLKRTSYDERGSCYRSVFAADPNSDTRILQKLPHHALTRCGKSARDRKTTSVASLRLLDREQRNRRKRYELSNLGSVSFRLPLTTVEGGAYLPALCSSPTSMERRLVR
jgi:hypothetical protein